MPTIKHKIIWLLIRACVGLLITLNGYANNWQFEVSPYLWATNMNGDIQVAEQRAHVSERFSDILKHLDIAGMLWLGAKKDKVGLFANAIYAKVSDNANLMADDTPISLKATNQMGFFTVGTSYAVYQKRYAKDKALSLDPYIGLRYTINHTTLKVLDPSASAKSNQNWLDPIIGLGFLASYNNWRFFFAADIGGTNFNKQKSCNIDGLIGYNPTSAKNWIFYCGYKYLYQKYIHGAGNSYFSWNTRLFGPVLGLSYNLAVIRRQR